jgi:outer membrane lipoprotein-sorting protein
MRSSSVVAGTALLLSLLPAFAASKQESRPAAQGAKPAQCKVATSPANGDALDRVLRRMDQTAADFHAAEADFVWTTYNSVAQSDVGTDKGKIYFRRSSKEIEMKAEVVPPSAKQILFADGRVKVYYPGTNEIQVYDTSAHRQEVEAFLVLGFGSSGSDLKKTFVVNYAGQEKIGDAQTDKLELVPAAVSVKQQFPKIDLWIDPQRGVSLRQQLFEQDGDYRTADYSNIKLNVKLPGDAFKLKTSGGAKTITH